MQNRKTKAITKKTIPTINLKSSEISESISSISVELLIAEYK